MPSGIYPRKPKIKKTCQVCGKTFEVHPCRKDTAKYCTRKCSGLSQQGKPSWNKGKKLPQFSRENSHQWKGGKYITMGYFYSRKPDHPRAMKNGYVKRANLVMEQKLGRYLTKDEVVHHINGNKSDDRIENLMFFPNRSEHSKYHHPKNTPFPLKSNK